MNGFKLLIVFGSFLTLAHFAHASEDPIFTKGAIIDRKTGDQIKADCYDDECRYIYFYLKSGQNEYDIGGPHIIEKFQDEVKLEKDQHYPIMPWMAATQLSSAAINYTGGASYLAYALVAPLAVAEGAVDVILAPGYGIAELVWAARIRNIEAALSGQSVEVSHFRFQKIQKLLIEIGSYSN